MGKITVNIDYYEIARSIKFINFYHKEIVRRIDSENFSKDLLKENLISFREHITNLTNILDQSIIDMGGRDEMVKG